MNQVFVRLLVGVTILEERTMDRVPAKGEYVWVGDNMHTVEDIHWRRDGHASVLLSKID